MRIGHTINLSSYKRLFSGLGLVLSSLVLAACSGSTERATATGAAAQELLAQNRIAEARTMVKQAIAQRDDILELHLLHARIEVAAGSPSGALAAYENAIALDASNAEALSGIASNSLQLGDMEKAEKAADTLLTTYPDDLKALLIKGLIKVLRHRGEEALALADQVLQLAPNAVEGSLLKGRALYMLRRRDEALEVVLKASRSSRDHPEIAQALAEIYRDRNNGPMLIAQLEILRAAASDDPALAIDEANALYKLEKPDRARALLWKALFDKRTDRGAAKTIANLWGEYDRDPLDAAAIAKLAKDGKPDVRREIAWYYLASGRPDQAMGVLGNLPYSEATGALRANIAIAKGRIADGDRLASAILDHDQTNCEALMARTLARSAMRQSKEAVISGQAAIAQCPQLVPAYIALARAKIATNGKDHLAADLIYREGLRNNPQSLRLARDYANWLEQRGEAARVIGVARTLTRSAPALVGGWRFYLNACRRHPEIGCVQDAEEGLNTAQRRFAIDLRPGEVAPIRLFGRLDSQGAS